MSAKLLCPLCDNNQFKKRTTTYPVKLSDGRQVNINRVAVNECNKCQHLIPTKSGTAKINRCIRTMAILFF